MLTVELGRFGRLDVVRPIDVEHQRQNNAINLPVLVDQPLEIVAQSREARPRLR